MHSYTAEFRGEVLAACDANEGTHDVAVRFKVSESWVRLIKQQRRETGQVAPKKAAPRQPKWQAWKDWLVTKITARPDSYLRECVERHEGTPQGGPFTPPTKVQNFRFAVIAVTACSLGKKGEVDPIDDTDLVGFDDDAIYHGAEDFAASMPIGLIKI
jgi:hypothetical protein